MIATAARLPTFFERVMLQPLFLLLPTKFRENFIVLQALTCFQIGTALLPHLALNKASTFIGSRVVSR